VFIVRGYSDVIWQTRLLSVLSSLLNHTQTSVCHHVMLTVRLACCTVFPWTCSGKKEEKEVSPKRWRGPNSLGPHPVKMGGRVPRVP